MTSFTFNTLIPAANNNPSIDQGPMLQNNVSTNGILGVDHVTFNTQGPAGPPNGSGGQHLQVTFNGKNVPAGAPTDPISVLYTNSGTASSVSEMFFRNQNRIFQVSPIKAWAYADNNGNILSSQSFNVDLITRNSAGVFTISLTPGALTGTAFAVIPAFSSATALAAKYAGIGANTFQLQFYVTTTGGLADPQTMSFIVIQI